MMTPMCRSHVHHQAIRRQHDEADVEEGEKIQQENNNPRPIMQITIVIFSSEYTRFSSILNGQRRLECIQSGLEGTTG